jgi:uroporphyrinogen-III synthase
MSQRGSHRILLTRSAEDCARWAETLAQCGFEAIEFPCISTEAIDTRASRARLARAARDTDWLVFTSKRGVEAFVTLVGDVSGLTANVACVGPATAAAAIAGLGRVDLSGAGGTAESLGNELIGLVGEDSRLHCLLVLAENAASTLESKLDAAGLHVERIDVYRTIPARPRKQKVRYSELGCDLVFLASPSAVTGFVNQVALDQTPAIVTIGPSSTAAAKRHGLPVRAQARVPSLDGLLESTQCPNET